MDSRRSGLGVGHSTETRDWIRLAPPVLAAIYPFLLDLFHWLVTGSRVAPFTTIVAAVTLTAAFAVSAAAYAFAVRFQEPQPPSTYELRTRRVAYLSVVAPTLFVFVGVAVGLIHSAISDKWVWLAIWGIVTLWASLGTESLPTETTRPKPILKLRVAHGIVATVVTIYVLFHIGNHLFGLAGPQAHATVMKWGRHVYRAPIIEPLLVCLMLFQVISGLRLAWRWSAISSDAIRVFQIASGVYLSLFILGHMNSVFIYARTFLQIDTAWDFATGAPIGLIYDAWNIRLVPHYALGVFFVLGHLVSGLRVVLLGHGVNRSTVDTLWKSGLVISAFISAAILCGMCGIRLFFCTQV